MKDRYVILLFGILTFLLYFPVLGNGFLTDDYASLYRLLIEKRVPFGDASRPLIDIFYQLPPFGASPVELLCF